MASHSYSYKAFLIMDQLRRRAGISVRQFLHIINISESGYSRISERVYSKVEGVLHYSIENKVKHGIDVLASGYAKNILSVTSIKKPITVIEVLRDIEMDLKVDAFEVLVDCDLEVLLSEANKVLNT